MLDIANATVLRGNAVILKDVSLQLRPGRLHAIIGANGSGKSTLLRIFLGLIKPQEGTVRVFDTDIEKFAFKLGIIPFCNLPESINSTMGI